MEPAASAHVRPTLRPVPFALPTGRLDRLTLEGQPDVVLGALAARGHELAFDILCRRFTPSLRSWARGLSVDADQVDDLVQETLVRAWSKRTLYDPQFSYYGWLQAILHRFRRDCHRRDAVRTGFAMETAQTVSDDEDLAGQGRWHGSPPSDLVLLAELATIRDAMLPLLEQMPAQQRAVLLAWAEGQELKDFAASRGEKEGTVRNRLFRAKRRLAELYVTCVGLPEEALAPE